MENLNVLHPTKQTDDVLFHEKKVYFSYLKPLHAPTADVFPDNGDLFERLRKLRLKKATQMNIPAFCIFSNVTLNDMAEKQPETPAEFLQVNSVGKRKLAQYGEDFLLEIKKWKEEKKRD